jgi:hypothetical protein
MSGYIIEEPNEEPIHYNNDNTINRPLALITNYWDEYSPVQRKRFNKVLRQLNETWYDVFNLFTFMRNNDISMSVENSNDMMKKVHRLFILQHKGKTEYYNEEKIRMRKQKGYINKKINKMKNTKQKL